MKLRSWEILSWQQASDVMEQAERIHRNFLQVVAGSHYSNSQGRASAWAPLVNVIETGQIAWVITALPGVDSSQIEIRLEGNELMIAGERPVPTCCTEGELKVWEIPLGRFERRLNLSPEIQFTIAETRFEDGLLIIKLTKAL